MFTRIFFTFQMVLFLIFSSVHATDPRHSADPKKDVPASLRRSAADMKLSGEQLLRVLSACLPERFNHASGNDPIDKWLSKGPNSSGTHK